MTHHGVGDHHQISFTAELGHREIGFQSAGLVHPLCVGDHARRAIHLVAGYAVEAAPGIAPLNQEFPHERHVHEDHVAARGVMLLLPAREPARPAPGQRAGVGPRARRAVPVWAFPAAHLLEIPAGGGQAIMERGFAHAPRGGQGHRRVVALVNHAEGFDGTLATVLGIGLVDVEAVDIEPRDVDIGKSADDPIGEHPTQAPARQNTDGIQARRHEVTSELRRFADDGTQVRRKALRTTEQFLHADFRCDRHA